MQNVYGAEGKFCVKYINGYGILNNDCGTSCADIIESAVGCSM